MANIQPGVVAAAILRARATIDTLPPPVSGIRASFRVPYGSNFKQWDTRGRLWVWVNRAWLYDAIGPRVRRDGVGALTGIPIHHEDAES